MKKDMKIARYGLKVVYRKELILTMEDDVDSEELLKIFLETQLKEKKELENYIINGNIDLDRIVDDYTPYLRKIIQNMVNNNLSEEDKEEIILDTFFILWKKYNENYYIKSLSSYIAGITRNLIKEKLKSFKYTIDIEQCENLVEYSNLDTYSQEREEINELYKKLNNLKEIDIKIINMFYYSAKPIKDIANELKISEVNVKTRLHRVRKKIKQELNRGGF